MCKEHWEQLRNRIAELGLSGLVSENGATATRRMESADEFGLNIANFDPLIGAHNLLIDQLIRVGGEGLVQHPGCPVCIVDYIHTKDCSEPDCPFSYAPWIDKAAEQTKEVWDQLQTDSRKGIPPLIEKKE